MPRRKRNQGINLEGLRRKCEDTGTVKQVVCRHIELPPMNRNFNPKETKKVTDIKGAIVRNVDTLIYIGKQTTSDHW